VRWQTGSEEQRTLEVEVARLISASEPLAGVIVSFADATAHRALEEDLERACR
jgi:hypothetical protein